MALMVQGLLYHDRHDHEKISFAKMYLSSYKRYVYVPDVHVNAGQVYQMETTADVDLN